MYYKKKLLITVSIMSNLTIGDVYPEARRSGTMAEIIDNEDFLDSAVEDVEQNTLEWFTEALGSVRLYRTDKGGEFGTILYGSVSTNNVHYVLLDDDPIMVFNAFSSQQSAHNAIQEFETSYPEADDACSIFCRICSMTDSSDSNEWPTIWESFLQRHSAGKYNAKFAYKEMCDLFSWA